MFPVDTPLQLRIILRSLRMARGLTQEELGVLLGVSQKRVARIEAAPELTSYDQIARYVTALGGHLVLTEPPRHEANEPATPYVGADTW